MKMFKFQNTVKELLPILAMVLLTSGCSESPTDDDDDNGGEPFIPFTSTISGQVTLENQPKHSNALIYLDSLDRGVSSDSNGNYTIQFSDNDSVYTGMFTIYYFLQDYDLDSAFIWLEDGLVRLDTMDVDSNGIISLRELSQIIRVQLWTDKEEYRIGDSIVVSGRYTNLLDDTLHLRFDPRWSEIGGLGLYRDSVSPSFSFYPLDQILTTLTIFLPPGENYEGQADDIFIPERSYYSYEPIILAEYVVIEAHVLPDRDKSLPNGIRDFIFHKWY